MEESDLSQSDGGVKVARRVYVGNLAWKTSWQDLKDHFGVAGEVKFADVLRSGGARSKGCGIVEFEHAESAKRAIQTLNHSVLDGRQIFVREDREDYELRDDGERGEIGTRSKNEDHRQLVLGKRVWVGNLAKAVTWKELKDHFRAAGTVLHADIMTNEDGSSKGCGLVEYDTPNGALRAISLFSNSLLCGQTITVREDREEAPVGLNQMENADSSEGNHVVIHGLPYRMAWQDLKDLVREVARGPVIRADVMKTVDGLSKGYGVVVLSNQEDAKTVISRLSGHVIDGRVLTAKFDKFNRK
jgi:RNA recognition motif-containing protein